jgi:hypothetical protein
VGWRRGGGIVVDDEVGIGLVVMSEERDMQEELDLSIEMEWGGASSAGAGAGGGGMADQNRMQEAGRAVVVTTTTADVTSRTRHSAIDVGRAGGEGRSRR